MSVPNIGPELPDPENPTADGARRGNPAPVYRDEAPTNDVQAASTRARAVSQRFGGARSTLSRPAPQQQSGELDEQE